MSEELIKNDALSRFELHSNGQLVGFIDYRLLDHVIELPHTEVDPAHSGKGYGQQLVQFALRDAQHEGYQVIPSCPFVARYIQRHPEFAELVAR